jgi:translation elongation factor EF-1beta
MVKVVEFKKRNFWSSSIDIEMLNNKIKTYEASGWKIIQIQPVTAFGGAVTAFYLLLEK